MLKSVDERSSFLFSLPNLPLNTIPQYGQGLNASAEALYESFLHLGQISLKINSPLHNQFDLFLYLHHTAHITNTISPDILQLPERLNWNNFGYISMNTFVINFKKSPAINDEYKARVAACLSRPLFCKYGCSGTLLSVR